MTPELIITYPDLRGCSIREARPEEVDPKDRSVSLEERRELQELFFVRVRSGGRETQENLTPRISWSS
jgi:hypothetical protein